MKKFIKLLKDIFCFILVEGMFILLFIETLIKLGVIEF